MTVVARPTGIVPAGHPRYVYLYPSGDIQLLGPIGRGAEYFNFLPRSVQSGTQAADREGWATVDVGREVGWAEVEDGYFVYWYSILNRPKITLHFVDQYLIIFFVTTLFPETNSTKYSPGFIFIKSILESVMLEFIS